MIYEQILKEFDDEFEGELWLGTRDYETSHRAEIKSFLKQSFIKYLEGEVERLETLEVPPYPIEDYSNNNLVALRDGAIMGYNQAISDQITHIKQQIKELQ